MSHLAFVLSQFPEMHETFILREFLEFRRQGVKFSVYSLKACHDPIVHPEVDSLLPQVRYSRFLLSRRVLLAQLQWLLTRPAAYLGSLWTLFRGTRGNPLSMAKALAVFPKTARFAIDMRNEGVTHIHAHWATMPTSVAMALSRLTEKPFSFTAHAWDIYVHNPTLADKLSHARFVVTCTRHNKEYLESLGGPEHSTDVILNYHGVDLSHFSLVEPTADSRGRILSIGRMVEQKGFVWLIRAIRKVRDRGYDVRCTIVGEGPDIRRLHTLIHELGLDDIVELKGPQPQDRLQDLYHGSRMFVLPCVVAKNNDRDGIPNVMVEAMALGLPVVSSRVSGIPELVVHERTGLLADERDVEGIASNIIRLLEDQELWDALRTEGRERVERMFDVTRNVGELIGHFRRYGAIP